MSDFSPSVDGSEQTEQECPVLDAVVEYDTGWFTAGYDLVEQYRPRFREAFLECPSGGIDGGESVLEAAARELREETGFEADRLEQLTTYYPSGWDRYTRSVVFATGLTPGEQVLDDGEYLDVRILPVDRALSVLGGDRDSPSVGWGLPPVLLAREAGLL